MTTTWQYFAKQSDSKALNPSTGDSSQVQDGLAMVSSVMRPLRMTKNMASMPWGADRDWAKGMEEAVLGLGLGFRGLGFSFGFRIKGYGFRASGYPGGPVLLTCTRTCCGCSDYR